MKSILLGLMFFLSLPSFASILKIKSGRVDISSELVEYKNYFAQIKRLISSKSFVAYVRNIKPDFLDFSTAGKGSVSEEGYGSTLLVDLQSDYFEIR